MTGVIAGAVLFPVAAIAEPRTVGLVGEGAEAVFESFEGCARYTAAVRPLDGRDTGNHTGSATTTSALVHLTRSDTCSDTFGVRIGRVDLDATEFRVRGDLGLASLRARVGMRDWLTGQTVPLDLDLSWRATEDVVRNSSHSHTRYPDGGMFVSHITGRIRRAVASGGVSDGSYDYAAAAGESRSASISSTRSGFVTLTR